MQREIKLHYFQRSNSAVAKKVTSATTLSGAYRAATIRILRGEYMTVTIYMDEQIVGMLSSYYGKVSVVCTRKDLL